MKDEKDPVLKYWQWLLTLPECYQWPWDDFSSREYNRQRVRRSFPYVITIESTKNELNEIEKWCQSEFGPKYSGTYWNPFYHKSDYHIEMSYSGVWTTVWALKTSYEDGFCDFCFKHADQGVLFKFVFGIDSNQFK